jgi:hypothetical protein
VPFFPQPAIIPIIAVAAFMSLLWPFGGGIVSMAVLAPPIFAFGAGWGIIYVALAVLSMGLLRRKSLEWAALLPGAMPFAVLGGVGMVLMPLAGAFMRRWGALSGFLGGLVIVVTAGLAGWTKLPYTFNPAPGESLTGAAHAMSPWTVLIELARFLDQRPELTLQIALFALFSLPLYSLTGRSFTRRLWGASGYLMAMFAAFVLLPILAVGAPVSLGLFLAGFGPCAIIAYLCALLISSKGPRPL